MSFKSLDLRVLIDALLIYEIRIETNNSFIEADLPTVSDPGPATAGRWQTYPRLASQYPCTGISFLQEVTPLLAFLDTCSIEWNRSICGRSRWRRLSAATSFISSQPPASQKLTFALPGNSKGGYQYDWPTCPYWFVISCIAAWFFFKFKTA